MKSLYGQRRPAPLALDEAFSLRKESWRLTLLAAELFHDMSELRGRQSVRV
jgi:hypothetical protein